jgi:hypothetical protein
MNCDFSRFCKSPHDINVIREACGILSETQEKVVQGKVAYYGMLEDFGGTVGGGNSL